MSEYLHRWDMSDRDETNRGGRSRRAHITHCSATTQDQDIEMWPDGPGWVMGAVEPESLSGGGRAWIYGGVVF